MKYKKGDMIITKGGNIYTINGDGIDFIGDTVLYPALTRNGIFTTLIDTHIKCKISNKIINLEEE